MKTQAKENIQIENTLKDFHSLNRKGKYKLADEIINFLKGEIKESALPGGGEIFSSDESMDKDRCMAYFEEWKGSLGKITEKHDEVSFNAKVHKERLKTHVKKSGEFGVPTYNFCFLKSFKHEGPVKHLAYVDVGDKQLIVAASEEVIKVWNAKNFTQLFTLRGHKGRISSLVVHNNLLFSSGEDMTIRVWDLNSQKCVKELTGHNDEVFKLEIIKHPAKTFLLSATKTNVVKFWDLESYKQTLHLSGQIIVQFDLQAWYRDEDRIFLISPREGSIEYWDVVSPTEVAKFKPNNWLNLIVKEDRVQPYKVYSSLITHAGLKPILLISSGWGGKSDHIQIYDLALMNLIRLIDHAPVDQLFNLKLKSNYVAGIFSAKSAVCFWDMDVYSEKYKKALKEATFESDKNLTLNSDSKIRTFLSVPYNKTNVLISGSDDGQVKLWDMDYTAGTSPLPISGPSNKVRHSLFYRQGGFYYIVLGFSEQLVQIWRSETGKSFHWQLNLPGYTEQNKEMKVERVPSNKISNLLAVSCKLSDIKIWDLHTGTCIRTIPNSSSRILAFKALSREHTSYIAYAQMDGNGCARRFIVNLKDGNSDDLGEWYPDHEDTVKIRSFSIDGQDYFAYEEYNNPVHIRNMSTMEEFENTFTDNFYYFAKPHFYFLEKRVDDKINQYSVLNLKTNSVIGQFQMEGANFVFPEFSYIPTEDNFAKSTLIAFSTYDYSIRFFSIGQGQLLDVKLAPCPARITSMLHIHTGALNLILCGDRSGVVSLWNLETLHSMDSLNGGSPHIVKLNYFETDDSVFLVSLHETSFKVWLLNYFKTLETVHGYKNFVLHQPAYHLDLNKEDLGNYLNKAKKEYEVEDEHKETNYVPELAVAEEKFEEVDQNPQHFEQNYNIDNNQENDDQENNHDNYQENNYEENNYDNYQENDNQDNYNDNYQENTNNYGNESQESTQIPNLHSHPLSYYESQSYLCKGCSTDYYENSAYGCGMCNFFVCSMCLNHVKNNPDYNTAIHYHSLYPNDSPYDWSCNDCQSYLRESTLAFSCEECGYYICTLCYFTS